MEDQWLSDRLNKFQEAYLTLNLGDYSTQLFIDIGIYNKPVPMDLLPVAMGLIMERFKRVIHLHPEYRKMMWQEKFDLWQTNCMIALALNCVKIESAHTPKDQLKCVP